MNVLSDAEAVAIVPTLSDEDYTLGAQLVWGLPPETTCGQAREIFETLREARASGCKVGFKVRA